MFNKYPIIRDIVAAKQLRQQEPEFYRGISNPKVRYQLAKNFLRWRKLTSVISNDARIANFNNTIGEGTIVCGGVQITNDITIGMGCLINLNCTIGHDTVIGDYCELSPGVHISGNAKIANTSVWRQLCFQK